jgi:predicted kinase
MMPKILGLIELSGLQASGKTTLAKVTLVLQSKVARVNRDDLRSMMRGSHFSGKDEKMIKAVEVACATAAIKEGYTVIIDDTNLSGNTVWKDLAKSLHVGHVKKHLVVTVEEAIRRDSLRPPGEQVGEAAIRATAKRMVTSK